MPAFRSVDAPEDFTPSGVMHLTDFMDANRMMPSTGRMPQMYQNPHHRYGTRLAKIPRRAQERARYMVAGIPYRIGIVTAPLALSPSISSASLTSSRASMAKNVMRAKGRTWKRPGSPLKAPPNRNMLAAR